MSRILVVDDDDLVRNLVQLILSMNGYEVETAGSGPDALRVLLRPGVGFDVMVTDVVMPGMDGGQLACEARVHLPGLPVLFMTGYQSSPGLEPFLAKPFTAEQLLAAVAALL